MSILKIQIFVWEIFKIGVFFLSRSGNRGSQAKSGLRRVNREGWTLLSFAVNAFFKRTIL